MKESTKIYSNIGKSSILETRKTSRDKISANLFASKQLAPAYV